MLVYRCMLAYQIFDPLMAYSRVLNVIIPRKTSHRGGTSLTLRFSKYVCFFRFVIYVRFTPSQSEETTSVFYKMISHLATLSESAQPTPFHNMLQDLDSHGQLLRVYTQNIDALEERAGLSFGIPTFPSRPRKRKVATPPTLDGSPATPARSSSSELSPAPSPPPQLLTPPRTAHSSNLTSPSSTPTPSPQLPRCIPLHGTLRNLYCPSCHHTLPLCTPQHLETLSSGNSLACPQCTELDGTRRLVGKRTRGVARLRPGVVLYNEPHREGEAERVGECVRRDLIGLGSGQLSRAGSTRKKRGGDDLLIVAGTSLRIPGAKRIVREFAKALHPNPPADSGDHALSGAPTVKTVYLNLDFPVPAREWDGVFDVWVQGDVQSFAHGFGQYQARVERGLSDTGASSLSVARMKMHTIVGRKESRAPINAGLGGKRSLEEPSLESIPHTSIKRSKQRVSPLADSLASSQPLPSTYPPRLASAAHRACTTPSPIKRYPEATRLTIKIRRPVGHVPTATTTGYTHPAVLVPHGSTPEAGFPSKTLAVFTDQQSGRKRLPTAAVAASNVMA